MVERTMSIKLKPQPEEHHVSQIIASASQDPRKFGIYTYCMPSLSFDTYIAAYEIFQKQKTQ